MEVLSERDESKGLVHSAFVVWLRGDGKGKIGNKMRGEHRFMLKMTQLVQL